MFGGFGYAVLESAYFATAHIGEKATAFIVVGGCIEGLSAAMVSSSLNGIVVQAHHFSSSGRLRVL